MALGLELLGTTFETEADDSWVIGEPVERRKTSEG